MVCIDDLGYFLSINRIDLALLENSSLVALWESRILILVDCIRNVDSRVDVLIEFMRRTAVPWSDGLEALIKKCSTEQNLRRREEFQEQYRLLQMRKMLLRYGIKNFNISDSTMVKGRVK